MFAYLIAVLQTYGKSVENCCNDTFHSFRERNFRIFTIGMFISSIGGWMQGMALSWLVYRLTGSAAALGIVIFAGNLPLLFLLFIGGIAADRYDKRKILLTCNSVAMLQALLLSYLQFTDEGSLGLIVALSIILGCTIAFEVPARQSLVPTLIKDQEHLANAIGLSSAGFHVSRMIGPALGGLIIAAYGEQLCFAINALSFVAALICLWALRLAQAEKDRTRERMSQSEKLIAKSAAKAQFYAILKRPGVYTLLFLAAFVTTCGLQYTVLMPAIASELLHGQSVAYGFLTTAAGVGALLGSLSIAYTGNKKGRRRRVGIAAVILSLALVPLAFSQSMAISIAAIVVAGICLSIHWNGGNSLMQQCVEPSSRGKLMGVYTTCTLGLAPFTALLAGWLAEQYGVTMALVASAAGMLCGALLYLIQVRRLKDLC
ncbi:MFS transporter [bacterium]|nr:MFS transporter [bacterium]MBP9810550.1 MFS transporter [bacterium]